MFLGQIKELETVDLTIIDAVTKENTDVVFTLCGLSSKKFRESLSKYNKAKSKDESIDGDLLLALCTVEWKNVTDEKGKEILCTEENAMKIYKQHKWVKSQVDIFISKESNFLQRKNIS